MIDLKPNTGRDKTLKALQNIELEGLKEIDRICRKHDIKYSLGGGSCLGQYRHGGIIPWDDDIDVDMTTENYEKFMKVAPKELDSNKFFLRCRATDKKHLRTCARLEMNYTALGIKRWDKKKMTVGIFIDIFQLSYLPNNKFLRKIVSSMLFYIRCIENYKMFHTYAKKANPKLKFLIEILAKIIPNKLLFIIENKLVHCCGNKKTNWIMDDAIINGNHGGYQSINLDEYEDVMFEGLKIMTKKNAKNFLRTLYGEKFDQWLPPASRISHHKWTNVDFGVYKNKYDVPDNYKDYLSTEYNYDKLKQMQKVSFDMIDKVHQICTENNLKYYVVGLNAYIKAYDVDEFGKTWREPFKIAMPREDYEKFANISSEKLGNKYFYQSYKTDSEYKYPYARIRLKYTYIRENKVPARLEEKYDNGFYIKIIPLDNTSNDAKKAKKHQRNIRYLNHFLALKWQNGDVASFFKSCLTFKIKLILLAPFSVKSIIKKLEKEQGKYANIETDYYVDSTGYQLNNIIVSKSVFGNGIKLEYNGHEFVFPKSLEQYVTCIDKTELTNMYKEVKSINYIKKEFPESYLTDEYQCSKQTLKDVGARYASCFLNYFDQEDYQLSILRYDEKNDKYLTNEEIFGE